ncbi:VOC family protein [uncultured Lacinutrix sp.]|uniref:VOC family protein n=1 Tax=uncultured Lacinutrix sp. TaxID=574032 RepID=UPI00262641F3|nr:VOC family protein [uncultured Lacinutrix sp.]
MIIREIILFTNNLQAQRQFYKTVLNFIIIEDNATHVSFKTGNSILTFQYNETIKPSHLAFNIPSDSIYHALNWLKKRVKIIDYEGEDITDFKAWNAKSIYFYDADNNIMEFIAREAITIKNNENFTADSIVSISEMAIAVDNIEVIYNQINAIKSISIFDGNFDRFCALGNSEGLFILIDKNKKKWYPTMTEAFTSDFIIKGDYNFSFINGKIKELS